VPGSSTVPVTAWSTTQGTVVRDSFPVSRTPPSSATGTTASSSGCPSVATDPPRSAPPSQYRWRSNA
jgi:hypothetical protein